MAAMGSTVIWEDDEVEVKKEEQAPVVVLRDSHRKDDYTYVCGGNRRGELGLGSDSSTMPCESLSAATAGRSKLPPITAGGCGEGFTILYGDGKLFIAGASSLYPQVLRSFTRSFHNLIAKEISCGRDHAVILTAEGEVWMWGNMSGHGGGAGLYDGDKIERVEVPWRAVSVSTGAHHTLIVSESGKVYSFGRNVEGQLGVGAREKGEGGDGARNDLEDEEGEGQWYALNQVQGIDEGDKAVHCSCGACHSVVVTRGGKAYGWGCNKKGQAGVGSTEVSIQVATPILVGGVNWLTASCGDQHTALLSQDRWCYVAGCGDWGQLGRAVSEGDAVSPLRVEAAGGGVLGLVCGAKHVILWNDATMMAWGDNRFGQLGVVHGPESRDQGHVLPLAVPDPFFALERVLGGAHAIHTAVCLSRRMRWDMFRVLLIGLVKGGPGCHLSVLPRGGGGEMGGGAGAYSPLLHKIIAMVAVRTVEEPKVRAKISKAY